MKQYHAVILAGATSPWLNCLAGTPYRISAKINGKKILNYIVDALQNSGCIDRIMLAAPKEAALDLPYGVEHTLSESALPDTAFAGSKALNDGGKLLFVTDDIPFLTSEAIIDFLGRCEENIDMQLQYPLIYKESCERAYPGVQRTYVCFKEGRFTGGNLTLCDRNIISDGQRVAKKIFDMRKSPFKMAKWVGWSFVCRFMLHKIALSEANEMASKMTGFRCQSVLTKYAEIGMDLDKPSDWQIMTKLMGK